MPFGLTISLLIYPTDTSKMIYKKSAINCTTIYTNQKIDYIIVNIPKLQTLFVTVKWGLSICSDS